VLSGAESRFVNVRRSRIPANAVREAKRRAAAAKTIESPVGVERVIVVSEAGNPVRNTARPLNENLTNAPEVVVQIFQNSEFQKCSQPSGSTPATLRS
jgi:hypothetical protein